MIEVGRGLLAGFVATLVISMLMILRMSMGLMTWFNPVEIMNLDAQKVLGTPSSEGMGWVIHFVVGTVLWGGLFGALAERLPGSTFTRRGLLFGTVVWLLVMVTLFPLAGSGFFASGFGLAVPVMTLITHWIFGAVMGATFGWLRSL